MERKNAGRTMLAVILLSMLALTISIHIARAVTPPYPAGYKPADLNGDGKIEGKDIIILIRWFGTNNVTGRWNPAPDLDNSGEVDGKDLTLLAMYFGQTWS